MDFNDSHRFKTWIRIGVLILLFPTWKLTHDFYKQIIYGLKVGNNPMPDIGFIIWVFVIIILFLSILLFFSISKLTIKINENVIKYQFFPIHLSFREIKWETIEKYEILSQRELYARAEQLKKSRKIKYVYMSFDNALLLYLKSGKLIILGIKNDKELDEYLNKIKLVPTWAHSPRRF